MNKYEQYLDKIEGKRNRVLQTLCTNGQNLYWAGIDEVLSNPSIFPCQGQTEARLQWVREMKLSGNRFIFVVRAHRGLYWLDTSATPPPIGFRHISKLWRDCE